MGTGCVQSRRTPRASGKEGVLKKTRAAGRGNPRGLPGGGQGQRGRKAWSPLGRKGWNLGCKPDLAYREISGASRSPRGSREGGAVRTRGCRRVTKCPPTPTSS